MLKKNIYKDFIFNIVGSIIPIVFLQLIIQPVMAKYLSTEIYGVALTIIGINNIIVQVSGVGINNTRILKQEFYDENNIKGDFNIILSILLIITIIVSFIWIKIVDKTINNISMFYLILLISMGLLKTYLSSEYNIKKTYKKVVYSNILLVIGYIIGLALFIKTNNWILIFLVGMLLSAVYILKTTDIIKEGFKITHNFKDTFKSALTISLSSLLISLVNYADRIILLPLVGPSQVAVYYTASTFGKVLAMGLSPVSSVLLSYFSKDKFMQNKKFWKMNLINFSLCVLFYIVSLFISEPIIEILYPSIFLEAKPFIKIANITAIINASAILIQPMILKFCDLNWQVYIQIIHLITYCVLSMIFVPKYGMIGFAYISLFISIIKTSILLLIGTASFRKNRTENIISKA